MIRRGASRLWGPWLPFRLVYLVWKMGTTAARLTGLAWVLLLICFFFMPPARPDPGLAPVNINYVWSTSDHAPQTFVPPPVWLIGLMIGLPVVLFAPVHFLLRRFAPQAPCAT